MEDCDRIIKEKIKEVLREGITNKYQVKKHVYLSLNRECRSRFSRLFNDLYTAVIDEINAGEPGAEVKQRKARDIEREPTGDFPAYTLAEALMVLLKHTRPEDAHDLMYSIVTPAVASPDPRIRRALFIPITSLTVAEILIKKRLHEIVRRVDGEAKAVLCSILPDAVGLALSYVIRWPESKRYAIKLLSEAGLMGCGDDSLH